LLPLGKHYNTLIKLAYTLKILFPAIVFLLLGFGVFGATRTASVSGNWSNSSTWGGASVPNSTDDVIINNGIAVTVNVAAVCASLTLQSGGTATTFTISGTNSLSVSGAVTINGGTGSGDNKIISVGAGSFSCSSIAMSDPGNDSRYCAVTLSTGTVTVTGNIAMGGSAIRNQCSISSTGTFLIGGNITGGDLITASGSTVNYNGAAQTCDVTTYSNLILSGTGTKSFSSAPTVNSLLSMEGTATISLAPTYGSNATLQYNTSTSRNAGAEWLNTFAASGGVVITNTGTITLNAAKVFNASVPLTINSGASLATSGNQLTFGGNFVNNGTFTAGSSPIVFANTVDTQNITAFTTTTISLVSVTKTGGTDTFAENENEFADFN